jgi:hypothetical protein
MAVRQAIAFENMLDGAAGRNRFAAAARILSQLIESFLESQQLELPHFEGDFLCHIEEGASTNDCANAIPKVPRIHISVDLELGIIQDLS